MDRYFNAGSQDANQSFRSLALHGIGGVGKSSVALRYAESRIHRKELDTMFRIASEKESTIRQSFTDISVRLKLPGAQPKDHDQNRTLVLDWLQNTLKYWLSASRGQAVLRARNHNFAFFPTDSGLEIKEWDTETGSQFLIHFFLTDVANQLTEEEDHSAHELSPKLSGHALALSLMAGLMHRRSWSNLEFVEMYKKHPQKVHGIFGNNSINALWDISFRSLNEKTRALLEVLAFLSPDSIPQNL
ncbi:hypothetical protein N7454_006176 [Penicillium verhagenii]|nr:hypothetical protein N7454_006176 [Penicillium verhagenii]